MSVTTLVASMDFERKLSLSSDIKLVIFDCDGVLIDSEGLSKRELIIMLRHLEVDISDVYFETHFLGHSFEHVSAKIKQDFAVTLPPTFRQEYQKALLSAFDSELKATSGLTEILTSLAVPRCIATSSSATRVARALAITGLDSYFVPNVFTASEVEKGKPAPDLFLHAAAKMGIAPEHCLVIEDSPAGIQAGKAANMHVVRYAGASHMQQWRKPSSPPEDDITTILQWQDLYALAPKLKSTRNIKR